MRALKDTILRALELTDPNNDYKDGRGVGRVFNGNLDWHSSVHAHWALLGLARYTGDTVLEERVLARLTPAALADEDRRLKQTPPDPAEEMPYGQAWLLVLLRELDKHPAGSGKSPEARELRRATEERLISFLEKSPFPEGRLKSKDVKAADPKYFSRAHSSWLFAYWLLKFSRPSDAFAARVAKLELKLEKRRAMILKQKQNEPRDFLYLPAVLWLIDHTAPVRTAKWEYTDAPTVFPEMPVSSANSKVSGSLLVSVWPHAMQSARGNLKSCERFNQVFNNLGTHPEFWRYDLADVQTFRTVGHWIPQFMWMAILLEQ